MGHEIAFAPCYVLCREMGARAGFSFVLTVKFHAEDCTDGIGTTVHCARHAINLGVLEMQ